MSIITLSKVNIFSLGKDFDDNSEKKIFGILLFRLTRYLVLL